MIVTASSCQNLNFDSEGKGLYQRHKMSNGSGWDGPLKSYSHFMKLNHKEVETHHEFSWSIPNQKWEEHRT